MNRYIKVCPRPKCGLKFLEGSEHFNDNVCVCSAPLILEKEFVFKVNNVFGDPNENNEIKKEEIFTLDASGGIHFNLKKEEELLDVDRVVIYIGGRIYKEIPLEYDETVFGRNSLTFKPDIDLSEIDMNRRTSRNHLMIYKQNGKYIARNMSSSSLHIERTAVPEGEDCELEDGNLIVLSRSVVMVFRKGK